MDKPRPRTFSTLQLATQKFKLRSLERVIGCNINIIKEADEHNGEDEEFVFYSLHNDFEGPQLYCSEALPLHFETIKWAEIVWKCPETAKSNQNCVCVKVWLRKQSKENCYKSALSSCHVSVGNATEPPDKLIFCWAVYFSGLSMLGKKPDVVFKNSNQLIFQLNGAYFASLDRFTTVKTEEHLTFTNQQHAISSSAPTTPFQMVSTRDSRSPSPALSHKTSNYQESSCRSMQIYFPRSTVRSSYDLDDLLQIQEKIRIRLQKIRESAEMVDEVKHLSVRCVTKNELQRRGRTASSSYSSSNYHQLYSHSMGKKLSILLSEQQQVEPASLLRAQKLQQQLENIRSKRDLLLSEKAAFRVRNENLRSQLDTLKAARQQLEQTLKKNINQLLRERALLAERQQHHLKQIQLRRHVAEHMERRMTSLCLELQEIYPIMKSSQGLCTVAGIPFPNADTYAIHHQSGSSVSSDHSPLALSASLGYVAHLCQMISVIIDQPLRNPIIHEGSRSRIRDIIKEVPYGSRDFPLYSRSLIPSKLVKYAIYLLNQNIAQLCFEITGISCDLRDTVENLMRIFSAFSQIDQNSYEGTRLSVRCERMRAHPCNRLDINKCVSNGSITKKPNQEKLNIDECDGFSKTRSSIDIRDLSVANSSSSVAGCTQTEETKRRYRYSRSTSSYSDSEIDKFHVVENKCFKSDSNIQTFQRQT